MTYKSEYNAEIWELYRGMGIRSRVLQIILASQFFKTESVSEHMVSEYCLRYRSHYFKCHSDGKSCLKVMRHAVLRPSDLRMKNRKQVLRAVENSRETEMDIVNDESRMPMNTFY